MKPWQLILLAIASAFVASRGGMGALLMIAKVALPIVLFLYVVKRVTLALFPDKRPNPKIDQGNDDPNVIRICSSCNREENSCLKCKMGFKKG